MTREAAQRWNLVYVTRRRYVHHLSCFVRMSLAFLRLTFFNSNLGRTVS